MQFKLTPRLSKAARSLLGWQQSDLMKASGVSISTIGAFEAKSEDATMTTMNNRALVQTFEAAGLRFIPENGGGVGLRFAKPGGKGEGA
jgi:transcriptional regulator with XRE-family HTH domain